MLDDRIARVASQVRLTVRDVADFPSPGIVFKDITPVLADASLMGLIVPAMCAPFLDAAITHVVGIESRGFLFGVPVALQLGAAFAPARKPGKLPWKTVRESYALEYGSDALELHVDAIGDDARVLIVDDVLATGGTAGAAARLIERLRGTVVAVAVLTELTFLRGRERLHPLAVHSVVKY